MSAPLFVEFRQSVHLSTKGLERAEKERKVVKRDRKGSNAGSCTSFLCGSPCLDMEGRKRPSILVIIKQVSDLARSYEYPDPEGSGAEIIKST